MAIAHWKEHTCLTFPEVNSGYSGNHIYFQRHTTACNSYVGMVTLLNSTGQPINVPTWCEESFGSLVHEIGHAIGLFHEQSRSDRDDYVRIITQNINSDSLDNFNLTLDNNYSVPYDYNSDMHYYKGAFSVNGYTTIETINPLYQDIIGQRLTGLSHMDKLIANRMYSCIDKNLANCSLSTDPCQNNGYMGKTCSCVCPFGTSGSNCETKTASHNDENLPRYSEKITTEGPVSSPLYPSEAPIGYEYRYKKWIVAPTCKLVKATFQDFYLKACSPSGTFVIRTDDMFNGGSGYCDGEIQPGYNDTFTSVSNQMLFYHWFSSGKWSATITFENDPSCSNPTTTSSTTTSTSTTTTTPTNTTTPSTTSTTTSTTTTTPSTTSTTMASSSTTTVTPSTTSTTTSTTTTTPSTTSTTTTSSTTASPTTTTTTVMSCPQGSSSMSFKSPNFPSYYPNNAMCIHKSISSVPSQAKIYFWTFKVKNGDYLLFQHRYGPPTKMKKSINKRKKVNPLRFPDNFIATFVSDNSGVHKGFYVTYAKTNDNCHGVINVNQAGSVKTPNYPKKHWKKIQCEWKFTTAPGSKIKLTINLRSVKCRKNYVAVDMRLGDICVYDKTAVTHLCGKKRRLTFTSTGNEIRIFYYGNKQDKGMKVFYQVA